MAIALPEKIETRPVDSLIAYARNSRTHSEEQVGQIAASMREWGWTNPILITEDETIIAGHGRVMAAQKLGLKEVPCIVARGWTEAQVRAYVITDNKLALNAGWDEELLKVEIESLQDMDFDIDLLGFSEDEIEDLLGVDEDEDNPYTDKVDTPTYEPVGDKPDITELFDDEHAMGLIEDIKNSNLPEKEKQFLMAAASRHIVFDYGKVANYYAHSDKETQELMEDSALVIIDFNKAIEQGYVKLNDKLNEIFLADNEFEDENE